MALKAEVGVNKTNSFLTSFIGLQKSEGFYNTALLNEECQEHASAPKDHKTQILLGVQEVYTLDLKTYEYVLVVIFKLRHLVCTGTI